MNKIHNLLFPKKAALIDILKEDLKIVEELYQNSCTSSIKSQQEFESDENGLKVLYEKKKELFTRLMVEDFISEIPNTVLEPALNIFGQQSEDIERWVLWQSYQMRRRVMVHPANPLKVEFYDGVLYFLKAFQELAHQHRVKKTLKPHTQNVASDMKKEPTAFENVDSFIEDMKKLPPIPEVEQDIPSVETT